MAFSKIFHFHIPKTGGTAVRDYLSTQVGPEQISPLLVGIRFSDALLQWEHKQALSGHVSFHQGDRLPSDYFSTTVLRDPIDRFLSDLFYQKNENPDQLRDTRMRVTTVAEHIEAAERKRADLVALQLTMLYPLGAGDSVDLALEQKLAAAKSALDMFHLVGVQEELDDFTCMLAAAMGWPQRPLPRSNQTRERISVRELDGALRRRLENLLAPEMDLYEYAHARFRAARRSRIASVAEHGKESLSPVSVPPTGSAPVSASASPAQPRNFGDKRCEILQVRVYGKMTNAAKVLCGEPISIEIEFTAHEPVPNVNIGLIIRDERGALLFGTNSLLLGDALELGEGRYCACFTMLNRFGRGRYSIDAALMKTLSHHDGCFHWMDRAARFEVSGSTTDYFEGRFMLDPDFGIAAIDGKGEVHRSLARTESTIARSFGKNNPPLTQFRASLELLSPLQALPAAADSIVQLRIRNLGEETWPNGGRAAPVCLAYRWYSKAGEMVVADGVRSSLPTNVAGGQGLVAPLRVLAPDVPGHYRLAISLVQESVAWFIEKQPESGCWADIDVV